MKVQPVPGRTWKEIDNDSKKFLKDFSPSLLEELSSFPVVDFIEFRLDMIGYEMELAELPFGKEAETDFEEKLIRLSEITYNGIHENNGRNRFTVIHEVGHAILHDSHFRQILRKEKPNTKLYRKNIKPYEDPECQANVFAACVLMPTNHIKKLAKDNVCIQDICEIFKVSYTAVENRLNGLHRF